MNATSNTIRKVLPPTMVIGPLLSVVAVCAWLAGCKTSGPSTQAGAGATPQTRPATGASAGRVLLHADFDRADGPWSGKVVSEDAPAGPSHALAAIPTDTHWARRASVGNGGEMEATADMVLTFRYRISKAIPITIYIFDATQKDNLRYDIPTPVVGTWTKAAVSINRDFRRNDHSPGKCQNGDVLRGVSFLSGKTGQDEFELVVDDVEIVGE